MYRFLMFMFKGRANCDKGFHIYMAGHQAVLAYQHIDLVLSIFIFAVYSLLSEL